MGSAKGEINSNVIIIILTLNKGGGVGGIIYPPKVDCNFFLLPFPKDFS